jgi:glycosyltransferase involved in cell wall biosynthesis
MRIGINASFLRKPASGIGQVTWHFLETLSKLPEAREHEFYLYTEEESLYPKLGHNFTVRTMLPFWKRDDQIRKWLWETKTVPREALADTCDIFLSLYQCASVFRLPHVMLVHDLIPEVFPSYRKTLKQKFFWSQTKRAIAKAESYAVVSRHTKSDLEKLLGSITKRMQVMYPSVDPIFQKEITLAEQGRVALKYQLPETFLYHGGGTEIRKNTELVLRGYKALQKIMPKGHLPKLVISGFLHDSSNKLATPVMDLISELELEDEVLTLGHVPQADVPILYSLAKLFLYPSRYEGFGLPVLEAMTVGVPVITCRVSSIPEVGGEAVLYTHPDDPEALARLIKKTLSDTELEERLSESGKHIAKNFRWHDFSEALLKQTLTVCHKKK